MSMRESDIEAKLVEKINRQGGLCLKMNSTSMKGLPDRMILLPDGRTIFVELKAHGKKPTELQRHVHRKLMAMNFPVYVIDSMAEVDAICNLSRTNIKKGEKKNAKS